MCDNYICTGPMASPSSADPVQSHQAIHAAPRRFQLRIPRALQITGLVIACILAGVAMVFGGVGCYILMDTDGVQPLTQSEIGSFFRWLVSKNPMIVAMAFNGGLILGLVSVTKLLELLGLVISKDAQAKALLEKKTS